MSERFVVRTIVEEIENPSREDLRKQIKHGLFAVHTSSTNMGYWLSSIEEIEDEVCDFDVAFIWYGDSGNSPEVHVYNMHELSPSEQEELKEKDLGSDDSMSTIKSILKIVSKEAAESITLYDGIEKEVLNVMMNVESENQYIDIGINGEVFPYENPLAFISPMVAMHKIKLLCDMLKSEVEASDENSVEIYIHGKTFTIKK